MATGLRLTNRLMLLPAPIVAEVGYLLGVTIVRPHHVKALTLLP